MKIRYEMSDRLRAYARASVPGATIPVVVVETRLDTCSNAWLTTPTEHEIVVVYDLAAPTLVDPPEEE